MVGIPILAVLVAVMVWAQRQRGAKALRFADVAAALAAFAGGAMLIEGKGYGLLALACSGWWFWQRGRAPPFAKPAIPVSEARALLSVPTGADKSAIRAAHRRLIAQTHPDQGGPADLAARINAARDVLLAELNEPAIPAS